MAVEQHNKQRALQNHKKNGFYPTSSTLQQLSPHSIFPHKRAPSAQFTSTFSITSFMSMCFSAGILYPASSRDSIYTPSSKYEKRNKKRKDSTHEAVRSEIRLAHLQNIKQKERLNGVYLWVILFCFFPVLLTKLMRRSSKFFWRCGRLERKKICSIIERTICIKEM